jgi:hypothetical protein
MSLPRIGGLVGATIWKAQFGRSGNMSLPK